MPDPATPPEPAERRADAPLAAGPPAVPGAAPGPDTPAFAWAVHGYLCAQIDRADQKAMFLFASVAAVLAFLQEKGATRLPWTGARWSLHALVAEVAVLALLGGAVAALLVVAPRLGGGPGAVYWRNIAERSRESYIGEVLSREPLQLVAATLGHCHDLGAICAAKYRMLNAALALGLAGLAAAVTYIAFG